MWSEKTKRIRNLLGYILFLLGFLGWTAILGMGSKDVVNNLNSEDFLTHDPSTYFFDLGLFTGFTLILLIYSFLIYVNVKQPLFLWFFIYTFLVSLYLGLAEKWVVILNEDWMTYFNIVNSLFILYAFKSFFQGVLNTSVYFKEQHRRMDFLFLLAGGLVFLQLILPHSMVLIVFSRGVFTLIITLIFYCTRNNPELTKVQVQLLQLSIISLILAGLSMTAVHLNLPGLINFVLIGVLFFVLHILCYSMAVLYRIKKLNDKNESLWKEIHQVKTALLGAHIEGVEEEKQRVMNELKSVVISDLDEIIVQAQNTKTELTSAVVSIRNDVLMMSVALSSSANERKADRFVQRLKTLISDYETDATQYKLIYLSTIINLSHGQQGHILKIMQEAFNNIEKYARASKVEIQLLQNWETFIISIEDNGIGFDTKKKMNGIGILNMRNRVIEMKGAFNISSIRGKGTNIIIRLDTP